MNNLKKFSIIFIFFFTPHLQAHESVAYINLDFLFNNTNIGKKIIKKINLLDEENIKQIKLEEKKLKDKEVKLLNEKNLLSKEMFNKNLNELKKEIKFFASENNKNKKKIQKIKNEELSKFLNKIQPLLNNYMEKNSLNILIDKKYIFIGKTELDITEKIINIINSELK
tara:strand:- start:833 stop:1339 length:507 start_codon:yes stop_codon:yes gene_type:complete